MAEQIASPSPTKEISAPLTNPGSPETHPSAPEFNPNAYSQALEDLLDQPQLTTYERLTEFLTLPDQAIRQLSPGQYEQYLYAVTNVEPNLARLQIDAITDQYAHSLYTLREQAHNQPNFHDQYLDLAMNIGEHMQTLLYRLSAKQTQPLPAEIIQKLYNHLHSDFPILREQTTQSLDSLLLQDEFNRPRKQDINLNQQVETDLITYLSSSNPEQLHTGQLLLESLWAYRPHQLKPLFQTALLQATTPQAAQQIYAAFAERLFEGEQNVLEILYHSPQPDLKAKATQILQWLSYVPEHGASANAEELYQRFDISHWNPNDELLQQELLFLQQHLKPGDQVLDVACGAGKDLIPLAQTGVNVIGIDLVEQNIQKLKQLYPEAKGLVGSWFHLPFADNSFDKAYCLGRSLPHLFTQAQWRQFLHEMGRITSEWYGDFPDPSQGFVGEQINKFDQTSDSHGIINSQPSIHIGTPDRQNYTLRYVPDDERIINIAKLNGWQAEKIHQINYHDQAGQPNTNYYWKFTKLPQPLTFQESLTAAQAIHQSGPPIELSYQRFTDSPVPTAAE